MKNFEKAMIGLDLSEMDEILIRKVAFVSEALGFKKLYLVHVAKDLVLPEEIRSAYPDLLAPMDETITAEIKSLVNQEKTLDKSIEIEIIVLEGNPMETFLRSAKVKDVDLIIMGRKDELPGSGSLSKNLAQKAPCSVLFLTERGPVAVPKKIMVPLDFSDHSNISFEFATQLNNNLNAEIIGLHIYDVPTGYYKTGKSYEEFAKIMEENAKKSYQDFLQKNKLRSFDCLFFLRDNGNDGRHILKLAKENNVDLIIMGSRGRTNSAAALLGSTAEKIVQLNNEIPMLVFKKKGETMSFLQALMKL
ncbi:universal stress protein [Belliella sp. R4-6]|uniref:Universal stress protein n=1 Tax=Belliella alkalica TaxID=1730871 RepID=A0ABS9VCR3_9BACT|nr:universal stress protein [Belliella alkalica]MCH7414163.1 universal stress protein [Belliella alkalica]